MPPDDIHGRKLILIKEGNKKEAVKWDNGLDTIQDINSI
jgi:hypothetical protein